MKQLVIRLIRLYQHLFWFHTMSPRCKYHPSCSEYTILAIEKHGAFLGLAKGLCRIVKCNPFSEGGLDLP